MDVVYDKQPRSKRSASSNAVFDSSSVRGHRWPKQGEDAMSMIPLGEAKTNLSRLVDEAAAGKVITITKHGRAVAQLVPIATPKVRRIGAMKGKLVIPDDFDAPLPDDLLDAFQGNC